MYLIHVALQFLLPKKPRSQYNTVVLSRFEDLFLQISEIEEVCLLCSLLYVYAAHKTG